MKAIILAAGYATRLYPLTMNKAKPLLTIANRPILEHILQKIKLIDEIDEVFVVTNDKFYQDFNSWLSTFSFSKSIKIVNDMTTSNEDRLGAVGDIHFVVDKESINDDLLVIAGDNMFGFSLQSFVNFFTSKNTSGVAFFDAKDKDAIRGKLGVGVLDGTQIVEFQEKPQEPKTTFASTACYFFAKHDIPLIGSAIEQGYADNAGDMIRFLVKSSQPHGFVFDEHWYDIGSFESLAAAKEEYEK